MEIEDSCCVVNPDVKKKFNNILCPLCKSGEIIGRVSNKTGKKYYKCTNSPFCKYISYEPLESRSEKLCPICKDYLVLKTGPYGNYYKCANSLCKHTESIVSKKSYSNYDDDLPF